MENKNGMTNERQKFKARFSYTDDMVTGLMAVEGARKVVDVLPLPPAGVLELKQVARQKASRGSVAIEGNPLNHREVLKAVAGSDRSPTEHAQEVRNYWRALEWLENKVNESTVITEDFIKTLHGLIMVRTGGGRRKKSMYRKGECPIVDTATRVIEYAPPRPEDVPKLMKNLTDWLNSKEAAALPGPVRASLLAHRFVSIHPFDDGNGRTTRALATAELWRSGYYMQGFISVEEFYDETRDAYYDNLQMDLPVDFYDGRHDPDHTPWLEYFIAILGRAAEEIREKAVGLYQKQRPDDAPWTTLSKRQQQLLMRLTARRANAPDDELIFVPGDVMDWFDISKQTAYDWLKEWVSDKFVQPYKAGNRIRYYSLTKDWLDLVDTVSRLSEGMNAGA